MKRHFGVQNKDKGLETVQSKNRKIENALLL